MRLMISLILLAVSLSLTGCETFDDHVKVPWILRCPLIAEIGGSEPYLKCQWYNGKDVDPRVFRLPIKDMITPGEDGKPLQKNKFVCTTAAGYADIENVVKAAERAWNANCK